MNAQNTAMPALLFGALCVCASVLGGCGQSDPQPKPEPSTSEPSTSEPSTPEPGTPTPGMPAVAASSAPPTLAAITSEHLADRIEFLASDDLQGRAPGTPGGERTRAYLIDQMQAIGLVPANGDSFEQPVGLVQQTLIPADSHLTLSTPNADDWPLDYGTETVFWSKQVRPEIDFADSELVFVGFGVVAPEYGWDDYAGIDVAGKTVVMLVNDPGFYLQGEAFNGKAMTYYGRWTYKYEEAARQGAAAALIVHETDPAAYGWGVVEGSWSGPQIDLERSDDGMSRTMLEGWISHAAAEDLFAKAGLDYEAQKQKALSGTFSPTPMGQITASASLRNVIGRNASANVAGILPGTTSPDEYVLFMAHWDHLGQGFAALDGGGDLISNGAVDNATGTAGILAIAETFAQAPTPPERSVLFLAVTAEESGLLGSAYFGERPLVPLKDIVGGINVDAMLPTGRSHDLLVIGYGASQLEDVLAGVAADYDKYLRPDAFPERGYFYRSDHISLAKLGVPMIYVDNGVDLMEGGEEAGRAFSDDYTANRYHKPADEYDANWDLSGIAETLTILRDTGANLAYGDDWPNWYDGNEFRALRDAQRAAGE